MADWLYDWMIRHGWHRALAELLADAAVIAFVLIVGIMAYGLFKICC